MAARTRMNEPWARKLPLSTFGVPESKTCTNCRLTESARPRSKLTGALGFRAVRVNCTVERDGALTRKMSMPSLALDRFPSTDRLVPGFKSPRAWAWPRSLLGSASRTEPPVPITDIVPEIAPFAPPPPAAPPPPPPQEVNCPAQASRRVESSAVRRQVKRRTWVQVITGGRVWWNLRRKLGPGPGRESEWVRKRILVNRVQMGLRPARSPGGACWRPSWGWLLAQNP